MTANPPPRTAIALLARWCLDNAASPPLPAEIEAVALLRFGQACRLPAAERDALSRLLWESQVSGGPKPPERKIQWFN